MSEKRDLMTAVDLARRYLRRESSSIPDWAVRKLIDVSLGRAESRALQQIRDWQIYDFVQDYREKSDLTWEQCYATVGRELYISDHAVKHGYHRALRRKRAGAIIDAPIIITRNRKRSKRSR
jgi:hypothetical protein